MPTIRGLSRIITLSRRSRRIRASLLAPAVHMKERRAIGLILGSSWTMDMAFQVL